MVLPHVLLDFCSGAEPQRAQVAPNHVRHVALPASGLLDPQVRPRAGPQPPCLAVARLDTRLPLWVPTQPTLTTSHAGQVEGRRRGRDRLACHPGPDLARRRHHRDDPRVGRVQAAVSISGLPPDASLVGRYRSSRPTAGPRRGGRRGGRGRPSRPASTSRRSSEPRGDVALPAQQPRPDVDAVTAVGGCCGPACGSWGRRCERYGGGFGVDAAVDDSGRIRMGGKGSGSRTGSRRAAGGRSACRCGP